MVTMFTCGPSVYQRAHIGNFRTFLFEDILARYLVYSGYSVRRGMNFTDIEDKAIQEAVKKKTTLKRLTEGNIREFCSEMKFLGMKRPDYLPRASEHVDVAVELILKLIGKGIAYWHNGNVYFDPLKAPGFGKLYGIDMSRWPLQKRRFHKDTYPGVQWNRGDFILWHGYKNGDQYYWDTAIGKGRPSWNIQDPSMVGEFFHETLSIYCGGVDNLYRHHDYTKAILESIRPYPMAKFWLHCSHLHIHGQKMSKSRGNVVYTDTLLGQGYSKAEIRFSLISGHYRQNLHYSDKLMRVSADKLRMFRRLLTNIKTKAMRNRSTNGRIGRILRRTFVEHMDNDLHVGNTIEGLRKTLSGVKIDSLSADEAAGVIRELRGIDDVLQVFF